MLMWPCQQTRLAYLDPTIRLTTYEMDVVAAKKSATKATAVPMHPANTIVSLLRTREHLFLTRNVKQISCQKIVSGEF